MLLRLIQRTVLYDLIKITLLALVGISALLMMVGAMVEAARQGLDPLQVLFVMPYLIPPTLPYTLPTCLLFASSVVYSGLSSSNQITALKAGGINVLTIVWPAIAMSIGISVLGIYLADQFIPACNKRLTDIIISDLESNLYAYLKQNGCIAEPKFPYEIYTDDVQDGKLINPKFKHRSSKGDKLYDVIMQASEATMKIEKRETGDVIVIKLVDGVATTDLANTIHLQGDNQSLEMPIPDSVKRQDEKMENLTFQGCWKKAVKRRDVMHKLNFELACIASSAALNGDPAYFAREVDSNRDYVKRMDRKSREAQAEVHLRIAQSAVAIPFILLGCPISILYQRREFLHTFFVCFLPIITIYYPVMILAFNIYKEGAGDLALTLWSPTILMMAISLPFLRRIVRY